jgi:hypothetical protein
MEEITVNLHNHTVMSDGSGTYYEIAQSGLNAGIDVIITTDHNIYIKNHDKYFYRDGKKILLLVGEEIHDPTSPPQNHLLVLNVEKELAILPSDPQNIIDAANKAQGISILAHPFGSELRILKEPDFPWLSWDVSDFSGLEIYNLLTEFKTQSANIFQLIKNVIYPEYFPMGANEHSVAKWDELLCAGRSINAYAGSDSHRIMKKIGPFHFVIFPYDFHFRALNNHLFIPEKLSGILETDKTIIYKALKTGRSFIGLDLIHPTTGFRFTADGENQTAWPGEQIRFENSVTLKIHIPKEAVCRLIHNGMVLRQWEKLQSTPVIVTETGYYRVECYLPYHQKLRGWIYSNPIFLVKG